MSVSHITSETFESEVVNAEGFVFVDFYAEWCGPCKLTSPIIEELSEDPQYKNIKFVEIDVDANLDLARTYNVLSIPTFIIFNKGKIVSQFVGGRSKQQFESEIKQVF